MEQRNSPNTESKKKPPCVPVYAPAHVKANIKLLARAEGNSTSSYILRLVHKDLREQADRLKALKEQAQATAAETVAA
jgi:hypothetical protein